MPDVPEGEPLFIVDNAAGGRSGVAYLREWCDLATRFDIATGYFDIGALLALDGEWQKLEGLRILMGDSVTRTTKKAMLQAVKARATSHLDESIEDVKRTDPFLDGADGVVAALREGRIVCRVYNRDKFHAKAYITHGKFDVLGAQALVGSSNFTKPGLTQNVELNIKIESGAEVAQLQRWYEDHWRKAVDVTPEVLRTIERHTAAHTPFEIYAKSLQSLVSRFDPSAAAWEQHHSKMFGRLDRYQQEGYGALVEIAHQRSGALLCDGVGLGKTYVGLMLIERLIARDGKRVVLFAPKAVTESVWLKELKKQLAHLGVISDIAPYSSLAIYNHTDLSRGGDYPAAFRQVMELADAVVIDEAHHFRNRGRKADGDDESTWSRYHRLSRVINGGPKSKEVYLLTATPINNSLNDFRHLVELFTDGDDSHFARTLGVTSVTARINRLTQQIAEELGSPEAAAEAPDRLQEVLSEDALFQGLVVQRSRSYAKRSQILDTGEAAAFPERRPPTVAAYSLRKTHGRLLELIDESFKREKPLFSLAMYYPLAYYKGDDDSIDPKLENRQKQVVGLIRTNFLKRFESSVYAFERSCDRLMRRLLAFLAKNATGTTELRLYERWLDQHADLFELSLHRQLELTGDDGDEDEATEDLIPQELLESFEALDRDEYDVPAMCMESLLDLDQIAALVDETRKWKASDDDKLRELVAMLRDARWRERKVLIFTEFADTARYLRRHLEAAGVDGVAELDGSSGADRADVIERFSPYYNDRSSADLAAEGREEIRVLVATDVLSEGLNLQDATRLVNYDIHWNPVRLMQRIGRVDRRLNPEVEERMVTDHPALEAERGHVEIVNFLPPDELETLLQLYKTVTFKTLLISKTLGIEGRQFLSPDDEFEALKDFNAAYEGELTAEEGLHLEYQRLIAADPGLEERLAALPGAIFSGCAAEEAGTFFCYELPALDITTGEFTLAAGTTRWYLHRPGEGVIEDATAIAEWIRATPDTNRVLSGDRGVLLAAKREVDKLIKDTYLRSIEAPLDAPPPRLVAWLELVAS